MSQIVFQAKQALFEAAKTHGFIDPATGEVPSCEEELSALPSYFHQAGRIDWQRVPLENTVKSQEGARASDVIANSDIVLTEYPLIACDPRQIEVWGGMPADLIFLSRDQRRVVLLENKIGSKFTYGVDPKDGQVGRQLSYLLAARPAQRYYMFLSSGRLLDRGWYTEVSEAVRFDSRAEVVRAYIMRWEHVLAAITTAQHAAGADR